MSIDRTAAILHEKLAQVAPIVTVRTPDASDKLTWVVEFAPEATQQEMDDAQAIIDAFDVAAAQQAEADFAAATESSLSEAKQYFKDNPAHLALVEDDLSSIEARVDGWDLSAIPNPARNELRAVIKTLIVTTRHLVKERRMG